ncbi:MAG: hypothetical protein AAF443_04215 [Chlamydiota bacterium]
MQVNNCDCFSEYTEPTCSTVEYLEEPVKNTYYQKECFYQKYSTDLLSGRQQTNPILFCQKEHAEYKNLSLKSGFIELDYLSQIPKGYLSYQDDLNGQIASDFIKRDQLYYQPKSSGRASSYSFIPKKYWEEIDCYCENKLERTAFFERIQLEQYVEKYDAWKHIIYLHFISVLAKKSLSKENQKNIEALILQQAKSIVDCAIHSQNQAERQLAIHACRTLILNTSRLFGPTAQSLRDLLAPILFYKPFQNSKNLFSNGLFYREWYGDFESYLFLYFTAKKITDLQLDPVDHKKEANFFSNYTLYALNNTNSQKKGLHETIKKVQQFALAQLQSIDSGKSAQLPLRAHCTKPFYLDKLSTQLSSACVAASPGFYTSTEIEYLGFGSSGVFLNRAIDFGNTDPIYLPIPKNEFLEKGVSPEALKEKDHELASFSNYAIETLKKQESLLDQKKIQELEDQLDEKEAAIFEDRTKIAAQLSYRDELLEEPLNYYESNYYKNYPKKVDWVSFPSMNLTRCLSTEKNPVTAVFEERLTESRKETLALIFQLKKECILDLKVALIVNDILRKIRQVQRPSYWKYHEKYMSRTGDLRIIPKEDLAKLHSEQNSHL